MLEQLFGSKTRVKLLRLFLNNPSQPFYLRELARRLKVQLNSIRREIDNLEKIGIVKVQLEETKEQVKEKGGMKKYFLTNVDFILFPELKALFIKSQLLLEKSFVNKIENIAKLQLFILTGVFVGHKGMSTDMLLVGNVNREKLAQSIKVFERDFGQNINYTIMSYQEFKYRKDITDKFLYDILEGEKITVIDKLLRN
ncbi:MAG: helix-turn-helix domain-containing protein [Candidatus Buchananbacteria bacterium]